MQRQQVTRGAVAHAVTGPVGTIAVTEPDAHSDSDSDASADTHAAAGTAASDTW